MQGAKETACEKENASELSQICTNLNAGLGLHFALGAPIFSRSYPSGLNASVLRLEVELETEPVWLWEKQVNDFTVSVEYCAQGTAGGP